VLQKKGVYGREMNPALWLFIGLKVGAAMRAVYRYDLNYTLLEVNHCKV